MNVRSCQVFNAWQLFFGERYPKISFFSFLFIYGMNSFQQTHFVSLSFKMTASKT